MQFEYKVSFGWQTNSYFGNSLLRKHSMNKCFYLPFFFFFFTFFFFFQTDMLILARASLKAEQRRLLGKDRLETLMRKLQDYQPSMKLCMFDFSLPFITLIKSVTSPLSSLSAMPPNFPYLHCWHLPSDLGSLLQAPQQGSL